MDKSVTNYPLGALVASVLAGAWRASPPVPNTTVDELSVVAPLLLGSSGGALAWSKVRNSDLRTSPTGEEFQDAYRFHSIRTLVRQHAIKNVLGILFSKRIDTILIKGWSVARLYPELGLRPYGDIDIVVSSEKYLYAQTVINEIESECTIDLHDGFGHLDYHTFDQLYDRSGIVNLDDVEVRVLCPEDQLRVLCVHLLHHNAFRPLWLCDVAVAIETRGEGFDWDICLTGNKRRADLVSCCIGLAHRLLQAEVADTPGEQRAKTLPNWLVSNVLRQWESPYSMLQPPATHRAPMAKYVRHPRGLLADLRNRWPRPIEATVYMGGPFNELPRWPFQLGECISRTAKFMSTLPKVLREG